MIEWFKNLTDANKIAVVVPVIGAAISGLFGLFKLFGKKKSSSTRKKLFQQKGPDNVAANIDGSGNTTNVAGRDINTGVGEREVLHQLVSVSKEVGKSEKEKEQLQKGIKERDDRIRQLEKEISQRQVGIDSGGSQRPQPTQEAKELAKLITQDDGPYAQALKAIADGNTKQADSLLDQTQRVLDAVQEKKDQAQAKIYMARMQNASYAGRPLDALQWCDKLKPLAGENSLILNNMAVVYLNNADYKEAEPLMERALAIDEASFSRDHPDVATDLNNMAELYRATNRLKEAEPLMKRVIEIFEKSLGKDHPNVATALNNLAALYQATNRLKEAEPLYKRAMKIDEASFGRDHPKVATRLNNLAQLYEATNRLKEAEPLMRRHLEIFIQFTRRTGHQHPNLKDAIDNYAGLLMEMGHSQDEVKARMRLIAPEMFE